MSLSTSVRGKLYKLFYSSSSLGRNYELPEAFVHCTVRENGTSLIPVCMANTIIRDLTGGYECYPEGTQYCYPFEFTENIFFRRKTANSILLNMLDYDSVIVETESCKYIGKHQMMFIKERERYIPLLLPMVKIKFEHVESEFHFYLKSAVLAVDKCVFERTDPLSKAIVRDLIPYYSKKEEVTVGMYNRDLMHTQYYHRPDVYITDLKDYISFGDNLNYRTSGILWDNFADMNCSFI